MSELLTLELPADLARRARDLAVATNRGVADVVIDWIRHAAAEIEVEALPDEALLSLCDATLEGDQQDSLSDLLVRQKDGPLTAGDRIRLNQLLTTYRRGLVVKARALKESVSRGLRAPLNNDAA